MMAMFVREIQKGKAACVAIDCGEFKLYYPPSGRANAEYSVCNSLMLDADDEEDAIEEAASHLGVDTNEIEVRYE
jgi:hypothetical protein